VAGSFRAAFAGAIGIGVFAAIGGVVGSFYLDTPSGGTIVLVALATFLLVLLAGRLTGRAILR
jgi:zinc transport system permease protein